MEHEFNVLVDHHQFYIQDADPEVEFDFKFDDASMDDQIEALPNVIMIHTWRAAGYVPVVVVVTEKQLPANLADWAWVAEGSLKITAGGLTLSSPWGDMDQIIQLPNGIYNLAVYYGDIDTCPYDYDTGADHYRVVLWPGQTARSVTVLKRETFDGDEPLPYRGSQSVGEIRQTLGAGDINARCHAAVTLARIGTPETVAALTLAFEDVSSSVRRVATSGLALLKTDKLELLAGRLADPDAQVRQRAIVILGGTEDSRAVGPLVRLLEDRDEDVRQTAAAALGELENIQAIAPVISLLKALTAEVRLATVNALYHIEQSAVGYGSLGQAMPLLTTLLQDTDNRVRQRTMDVLGNVKKVLPDMDSSIEAVIAGLHDRDWKIRESAAEALGKFNDKRAVTPLIEALTDEHFRVQVQAALALGQGGNERAIEPLIEATRNPIRNVRDCAIDALSRIGGPRVVAFLLAALLAVDEYDAVPEAAVQALIQLKDSSTIEPLTALLGHKDKKVRAWAAKILNELK